MWHTYLGLVCHLFGGSMKKSLGLLAATIVLLAASGCAGDDSSADAATPTPSPSASESPAEDTASVADFYAIVLKTRPGIDEWIEDWDSNKCSTSFVASGKDPLCSMILMRAYMSAGIVESSLNGGQKKGAPAYVGEPPAEIERVLQSTIKAAQKVQAAEDDRKAACPDGECTGVSLNLVMAMDDLQAELASWDAYAK